MPTSDTPRLQERWTDGWRFHRGDVAEGQAPARDDRGWREVTVPHDWSLEDIPDAASEGDRIISGPFDSTSVAGGHVGYTVGGVGWYRRTFEVDESLRAKRLTLTFDGVYMQAEVWLNGEFLGEHPYGYTPFRFDLTLHVRFGEPNVLAVRMDSSGTTSRWYCGSGIYRQVHLTATEPLHLDEWALAVSTPQVSAERAAVRVAAQVANSGEAAKTVLTALVVDAEGQVVAGTRSELTMAAGETQNVAQDLQVTSPALWSPDDPALYSLVSSLSVDGVLVDEIRTPFGIRSVDISAEQGLLLSGQPLELRGGCVHHDNGPLGACTYERAEARRVELLKAAGFNAIRTAHNPPSTAFLDACDRLGMLVMDEAFDCWQKQKNPEDYHRFFDEWWERDIAAMVLRDRNHPCVFAWSIGNEVVEQEKGDAEGAVLGGKLAAHVRALDPTRAVAIGAIPAPIRGRSSTRSSLTSTCAATTTSGSGTSRTTSASHSG